MAIPNWVMIITFATFAGPHAAFETSWLWWLTGVPPVDEPYIAASGDPLGSTDETGGKADAPEDHLREGYAHIWGYSVLHFDLKSWFGQAWFSTPLAPGQLSSTGGWGLYFLDRLGVLACGDFWPWVGWGCVITSLAFLAMLCLYLPRGAFDHLFWDLALNDHEN